MATKAIILIETAVGKSREVAIALGKVNGVQSANVVTGPYDVIAVIETPDMAAIGTLVEQNVHTLAGVMRTVTCVSVVQ